MVPTRRSIDENASLHDRSENNTMDTPYIPAVKTRTYGRNKKSVIYDNMVGMLPNGKPLNIKTHSPNVKIIAPK